MTETIEARLRAFYELRATEEPASDPEALLRFRKALNLADVTAAERVLDLGAKRGGLLDTIIANNINVYYTGVDLSETNVQLASAASARFIRADVTSRLPFDDASFDCVFCLELLEHLTIPIALLCEIRRLLTDSGRAIISVPSPYSWVELARELLHRPDPEGHLNAFTMPIMTNLAALAGLRVDQQIGTSLRIPKTLRLIPTNSILARSRMYLLRPTDSPVFAGRAVELAWASEGLSSRQ